MADIITSRPLVPKASFGFSRVEGSIGTSIYRFLWRTKVVITQFDDSGTPSYQEVASVDFTDFAIIDVEGVNRPGSTRHFRAG